MTTDNSTASNSNNMALRDRLITLEVELKNLSNRSVEDRKLLLDIKDAGQHSAGKMDVMLSGIKLSNEHASHREKEIESRFSLQAQHLAKHDREIADLTSKWWFIRGMGAVLTLAWALVVAYLIFRLQQGK